MLRVFNTVLMQLNNLVVVVGSNGDVSYVGPSAERMLGFKTGELLGDKWWTKTCHNIADPEQRKTEVGFFLRQVSAGKTIVAPVEHKINTANGDSRWFSWNLSAGPDGSLVKIGYDITERKQKEQEILVKNKEHSDQTDRELLTMGEACNLLRIRSSTTVYRLIREQNLTFKKVGRRTLFSKQDIIKFLTNKSIMT